MTRRRWPRVLAGILALLMIGGAVFRAQLPRLMLDRFHRDSARLGADYRGLAAGVDIDLWAMRYRWRNVRVVRRDGRIATPLVAIESFEVQLDPIQRRSRLQIDGVRVHVVGGPGDAVQTGEGVAWRRLLDQLATGVPVNRVDFTDTAVRYHHARHPALVVTLDNLHGGIDGLSEASAHLAAQGLLMAHAPLQFDARFDPRGAPDAFRLRARAREVELPKLDRFARRFARLDFHAGEAELGLALDWTPPRIQGELQALLSGVDVFDLQQDVGERGVLGAVRELVAGVALAKEPGTRRIRREFAIDAPVEPMPPDNFGGLHAMLQAALSDLGRHVPE